MFNTAQNGFTLVELLLVVSVIAILSGFLIPGFSNYIDTQNVIQGVELFKSDLRSVQNKALTGVDSSNGSTKYWGIKIISQDASNYYTFKSAENTASACDAVNISAATKSETLPGEVVIRNAQGVCIFFSMKNGDAIFQNNGGNTSIGIAYPGQTACEGVTVNSVGMIRTTDLCP